MIDGFFFPVNDLRTPDYGDKSWVKRKEKGPGKFSEMVQSVTFPLNKSKL